MPFLLVDFTCSVCRVTGFLLSFGPVVCTFVVAAMVAGSRKPLGEYIKKKKKKKKNPIYALIIYYTYVDIDSSPSRHVFKIYFQFDERYLPKKPLAM